MGVASMEILADSKRNPRERPLKRADWPLALLIAVLAIAAALRCIAIVRTVAPARDSLRFLPDAQLLLERPFAEALQTMNSHPLYPMTLAGIRLLLAQAGREDPLTWFQWGQAWSATCWLGFLAASYAVGRRLWNPRIAAVGCLAMAITPRQVHYSVDLLSDNLHAWLWMGSFWAGLNALESRRPGWHTVCGLLAAAAYWTRMEAVLLPLVFACGWLAAQLSPPFRWRLRESVFCASAFMLSFAMPVIAYIGTSGKISPRNSSRSILGLSTVAEPRIEPTEALVDSIAGRSVAAAVTRTCAFAESAAGDSTAESPPSPTIPKIDNPALITKPFDRPDGYELEGLGPALARLVYELGQETRGWAAALALYAIFDRRRTRSHRPAGLLAAVAFAGCCAMLAALQMKAGYMAGRYLMPVMPFLFFHAVAGASALIRRIAAWPRLPWERRWPEEVFSRRRIWVPTAIVAAVAAGLCLPESLRPLHPHREGHMLAAEWIRSHTAADELVFDPTGFCSFFANRPNWKPNERNADRPPVRIAVIDPSTVYRTDYATHRAIAKVNEMGRTAAQFQRSAGSDRVGVYVFELPNPPALARSANRIENSRR